MPTPRRASSASPRILIVDGNRTFLRTLERTLLPDRYAIRTASDLDGAIAELAHGEFDLLITEVSLPGPSGFDLIRRLRQDPARASLPVVLITSVADAADLEKARQLGVVDLLLKPVRPQLVRERIRRALEELGVLREPASAAPLPPPAAESPAVPAPPVRESDAVTGGMAIPRAPRAESATAALADPRMHDVRVPVFRTATHRVLELLGDAEATVKQVARIVETDPCLSSSVLKVVNSAYYGLRKAVSTVPDACALLGLRDLGSICLGATVSELLLVREDQVSRDCWSHCLATGYASREIGTAIGLPRNSDPGLAGILHGIGILATVASPRIDHEAIHARVRERRCRWAEAERELLGFDHAELGGEIARQWGLPTWIGRVIEASEDPAKAGRPDEWAVAVASLAVQRRNEHAFPRHPEPNALLGELAQSRPNLWSKIEERLETLAQAAWEQPDPAGVLVAQD